MHFHRLIMEGANHRRPTGASAFLAIEFLLDTDAQVRTLDPAARWAVWLTLQTQLFVSIRRSKRP